MGPGSTSPASSESRRPQQGGFSAAYPDTLGPVIQTTGRTKGCISMLPYSAACWCSPPSHATRSRLSVREVRRAWRSPGRIALDGLPQDLAQQHRLDPFRTVRRFATYVFRRTADLKSSNPTPMNANPESTGTSIDMPPVLGSTLLSAIVWGITPSLEFTSPAFVLASSMLALRSTLPASPPPSLLLPTTRHPSPPMPVELIIGKVSLGPLGNWSFSGSTGMGTMSLSGLSLTASGKDSPSVLLPLATMVPSDSNVMCALSPSLILKGTPRSLIVMVN